MEKSAKKRNLEVVMFEKYAIGTMDHASAITQMRAARPDWVFATGYINDLILIRKQMSDLGVTAPIVTMIAGPAYKEFIDAIGPLAENVSSAAWWHPAVRYDGKGVFGSTENFNKVWEQKYKDEPDYAQASAAAAGEIFQLAVETAEQYRSETGARRARRSGRHDVLWTHQVRCHRPDQVIRSAGVPDPGWKAGRALSRLRQAGRAQDRS